MINFFLYIVELAIQDVHVHIFWQELMHPLVYIAMHLTVFTLFFLIVMLLQKFENDFTKDVR